MERMENLFYKQLEKECEQPKAVTWYLYVRYWDGLVAYECRTADLYHAIGKLYCKSFEKIERVDYSLIKPVTIPVHPYPYTLPV